MSQIDLFGAETPVAELDLGPVQKILAQRIRELEGSDPITTDEAGAIVHAYRGKHSEETRCAYCAIDGREALARLDARRPLEERGSGLDRAPHGGPVQADTGARSSSGPLPAPDENRAGYAHAGGSDTERHAARRVMPNTGTARRRVLQLLARAREHGKTDEELSLELGIRLYTAAPRRKELLDDGWIMDSGQRRATTTGCMAIVWTLTAEARADRRLLELLRAAA